MNKYYDEVIAAIRDAESIHIDQANELKDTDTADICTEISRGADKYLWFVEAHAQAPN